MTKAIVRLALVALIFAPIALLAQNAAQPVAAPNPAHLSVDATAPISAVSPTLYGLMTEEINYSYDRCV